MMMAAALGVLVSCGSVKSGEEVVAASRDSKVVVAYVTSWSEVMPDPQYMTHINYAFGHVNESFNGVKIDNEERLKQIVDLRKQKPELKVLLSIGGVVKIMLNYNLVAVPSVNIYGAPIGTLVCFAITAALNLMFVSRTTEDKPRYFAIFAKPLFASFLMAEGAKLA